MGLLISAVYFFCSLVKSIRGIRISEAYLLLRGMPFRFYLSNYTLPQHYCMVQHANRYCIRIDYSGLSSA